MKLPLIPNLLLSAALMFAGNAAFAHDDGTLDEMKAPNGGQLRMAGPYHFELLVDKNNKEAKDSPVTVYLTDRSCCRSGSPIPMPLLAWNSVRV